jgi:hypothetical protein
VEAGSGLILPNSIGALLLTKFDRNPIYPHPFRRTKSAVLQRRFPEHFLGAAPLPLLPGFRGKIWLMVEVEKDHEQERQGKYMRRQKRLADSPSLPEIDLSAWRSGKSSVSANYKGLKKQGTR